ncbi:hypothetical protein TVAG_119990 [Trichomonas vaginalis G3]|uniref:DUF3447 domain-containing protein n=1 Tax=Trichomonas vaginalis (strain ATCC PRA-98 / G3) TaxID=412133 RepID=A2D7E5_TRIV3|nr:protein ubiquitination [Trichomonas vaginalis G3]EAY23662.1 hypothetical protein TVAG_119990 [Trichomonas vaginalis G3]KAI5490154.1 protein ubiquitination [Trichomonas vaginalis G3]|eukprot:XP_001276910.1 hypothetical protein [Trichomonas vaginalis G3]
MIANIDSLIKNNIEQFCLVEDLVWDLSQENLEENEQKLIQILKETSMQKYVIHTISAATKYRPTINNILLKLTEILQNEFPIFTELLDSWKQSVPSEIEEHLMSDDVEYFKNDTKSENKENNFELSALYGAVNVFNYFLSEEMAINSKTAKNASISGKMDILKEILSKKKNYTGTIVQYSLISHQNENLDLLATKDSPKLKMSINDLFTRSNIHAISKLVSLNSILTKDNFKLVQFAIQMESPQLLDFFCVKLEVKLSSDTSNFENIYKLIFQVKNNRPELISKLLLNGLSPRAMLNIEDIYHDPLSLAITNKDEQTAMILLEHGANPSFYLITKGKTYPMLCLAIKHKLFNLAERLIPITDVNEPTYVLNQNNHKIYKKNPLIYAIKYQNLNLCGKLLENGADPNYDLLEYSPFAYCGKTSNIEYFSFLFSHAQVDATKKHDFVILQNTPLSCCIKNHNVEMTKLILDIGFNPWSPFVDTTEMRIVNHLDYAKKFGNQEIVQIIEERMKKYQSVCEKFKAIESVQLDQKGFTKPFISKEDLNKLHRGFVYTAKIKMMGSEELIQAFNFLHGIGVISDIIKL